MYQVNSGIYSNILELANKKLGSLTHEIEKGYENKTKKSEVEDRIDMLESELLKADEMIARLKNVIKSIDSYITERKEKRMATLNSAISVASSIVPDAMTDVKLRWSDDGKDVWLETGDGMVTGLCEGDGYGAIISIIYRTILLKNKPDCLMFLLLDEPFSRLSPERSKILSAYLPVINEDMQVNLIEHKPETRENVDCVVYKFYKSGVTTLVEKE